MKPVFEIFRDRRGEWRFRLRARNGKIIASSEGYSHRRNVLKGVNAVQSCVDDADVIYV